MRIRMTNDALVPVNHFQSAWHHNYICNYKVKALYTHSQQATPTRNKQIQSGNEQDSEIG